VKFYSTNNKNKFYSLREAVVKGLPEDKGLFMPAYFPPLENKFLDDANGLSFSETSLHTAKTLLGDSIGEPVLERIIRDAFDFDLPLKQITDNIYVLELFHGPTLAFKDFGARFMAGLMEHYVQDSARKLTILVATSGDTGGAVANAFYGKEGIEVIILYPEGKVSGLQEKQLTTYGRNITALKVSGTFDDCQRLVKAAFNDQTVAAKWWLSSANSINIARLIPQSFYYVYGWSRLASSGKKTVFSVPSGNFGNLTAGLFAWKMGVPVSRFVASTNVNDIVPQYLISGNYRPKPSMQTLSNAMDVGDPSNFARLQDIFKGDVSAMTDTISGFACNDRMTSNAIKEVSSRYGYLPDPHGAVAFLGLQDYLEKNKRDINGIFLETAHPAKFAETVEKITGTRIVLPEPLARLENQTGNSVPMSTSFDDFKAFLMSCTS